MNQQRVNLYGLFYEPETGRIYDGQGRLQTYTFQNVTITDQYTGMVYSANPLHFATKETADKILEHVKSLVPQMDVKLIDLAWAGGPFLRPAVEWAVELPGGGCLNCGLVANTLMRSGSLGDSIVRAHIAQLTGQMAA